MKTTKSYRRCVGFALASVLSLLHGATIPPPAYAFLFGNADDYSAFSINGDVTIGNAAKVSVNNVGEIVGRNIIVGNNSLVGHDAIAFPGNLITLGSFSKVNGACLTGTGGAVNLANGAKCGSTDASGTNIKIARADGAGSGIAAFETTLYPTEYRGPLNVAVAKKATITGLSFGFRDVIEIPSVTLENSSTLTLSAGPQDGIVLKITGDLRIGTGVRIVTADGIPANHVIIYVAGNVAAWGNNTTINATLVAPHSACTVGGGARIDGAVLCGGDVTFLQSSSLTFNPSLVEPLDIPPLPPLSLGNAAGFVIVSTGGDTRLGNVTITNPAAPEAGDIGGKMVSIGNNSTIQGDVVASTDSGDGISLGNFTKVKQTCVTNGSTVHTGSGATCASTDVTGNNAKLEALALAGSDVNSLASLLASSIGPVDETLPAVNIPVGKSQTVSCIARDRTVVLIPSIATGSSATLKIACSADQFIVMRVPGGVTLGSGFKVVLNGGITAGRVLFDLEGSSTDPVLIGASSTFNGTLIAPARDCLANTGATINGQLVCGGNVTVGGNLKATYIPMIEIPWD